MKERYLPVGQCAYCKEQGPLREDKHKKVSCIPCLIDKGEE